MASFPALMFKPSVFKPKSSAAPFDHGLRCSLRYLSKSILAGAKRRSRQRSLLTEARLDKGRDPSWIGPHIRLGTPVYFWRDGKVVAEKP